MTGTTFKINNGENQTRKRTHRRDEKNTQG